MGPYCIGIDQFAYMYEQLVQRLLFSAYKSNSNVFIFIKTLLKAGYVSKAQDGSFFSGCC